jgi:hypothetical protein
VPISADTTSGSSLASALTRVAEITAAIGELESDGWSVKDEFRACSATISTPGSAGVPGWETLDALTDVADLELAFHHGPASFELGRRGTGELEFSAGPLGEPDAVFVGSELVQAQEAWAGKVAAATSLVGDWVARLTVDLAAPLAALRGDVSWRAVRRATVLEQTIAAYPWWRIREIVEDHERPVAVIVTGETDLDLRTPAFAVVSADLVQANDLRLSTFATRRRSLQRLAANHIPPGVVVPEQLDFEDDKRGGDAPFLTLLRKFADASAWAWLSNETSVAEDATPATLEFFGYRRRFFMIGRNGFAAKEQRPLDLYAWATAEESPDRILAIRQVISLYEGDTLPDKPQDVIRAAEPLYLALRASEVAAVLESQRQARAIAVDAARESAATAQSAAKSAAERTIASLAAVAGIVVANATAGLSAHDARAFSIGIIALFGFLVAWTAVVEGPTMGAPLSSFAADIDVIARLIGPEERAAILKMAALAKASRAVWRTRIAAPLVYLAGAVITFAIAHYRFDLLHRI